MEIIDDDSEQNKQEDQYKDLAAWISSKCDDWREHRHQNYDDRWAMYYRIWRGLWEPEDKSRQTERARFISPATQQAIDTHVSDIEEACFDRGPFFDIRDDDDQPDDVSGIRKTLMIDFAKCKIRKSVVDSLFNGGIYGTGIGEIVVTEDTDRYPTTMPIPGAPMHAIGTMEKKRVYVKVKPIQPNNFLIDPNAKDIEGALGCAIEEFVSRHSLVQEIEKGNYRDVDLESSPDDSNLAPSFSNDSINSDKVRVIRYYGLVPAALLTPAEEDVEDLFPEDGEDESLEGLVEAIVFLADDSKVLKAEKNSFMMQDRPIVAYQDDTVPNSFWGRGVAEKAFNCQRALDAELRSRMDNLALVSTPMMAMDASRMPRGSKFEIKPGGSVLTNGNPKDILNPFTFGQLDSNSYQQAREFERMLSMATSTIDSGTMAGAMGGNADPGTMALSMGSILQKQKRSLVNFQESFLIPLVQKVAWRYMQYDPERYPTKDFSFIPTASLGIMARGYEQSQFAMLLQTMGSDSPLYPLLLRSIIDNSSVSNRDDLLKAIDASLQPKPEQQQASMQAQQMQMQEASAKVAQSQAQAQKTMAETEKIKLETQFLPQKTEAEIISATTNNLPDDPEDKIFNRRLEIADRLLKEREIKSKEKIVNEQMSQGGSNE